MMVIDSFSGTYRWLSNFWGVRIEVDGWVFDSVEAAFQSSKTLTNRELFVGVAPGVAKRLGRTVTLRPGWNDMRVEVMRELLVVKFEVYVLRELLKETGNAELIEGNRWGDTFWGVSGGVGKNHLGKLLMEVRNGVLMY